MSHVTTEFCNWKDATVAFGKHLQSKSHIEAVEAIITLPKQTKDVGVQLSFAHKAEKEEARDTLQMILSSVRFLARQGLALRGDGSDVSSNLTQLLNVRAEDNPKILPRRLASICIMIIRMRC